MLKSIKTNLIDEVTTLKLAPLFLLVIAVFARLLPHPANFAPIAAMALFSGAHFSRRQALILPLVAMFLSDMLIDFYGLEMLFVYGSFVCISLLGSFLKERTNVANLLLASFFSSCFFYVVTNFGVWLVGTMYTKDLTGLVDCYVAAIPFFRNTFAGDLFSVTIFFGSYALLKKFGKQLLPVKYFQIAF